MTQVVPIQSVIPSGQSYRISIRRMVDVLRKQGQIEPLQVAHYVTTQTGATYITHYNDPHGADIVYAALELNWPTLLVVVNTKYEQ